MVRCCRHPAGLPTGLQFLARPWDEGVLLKFAYAFEQRTQHRRPPILNEPVPLSTVPIATATGQTPAQGVQYADAQAADLGG